MQVGAYRTGERISHAAGLHLLHQLEMKTMHHCNHS